MIIYQNCLSSFGIAIKGDYPSTAKCLTFKYNMEVNYAIYRTKATTMGVNGA
jgi:hypothetical protein